ncbi:MAG: hypothetical protein FJ100_14600 [Deltaproteobacteria bacterium]|nr:hypothetical protein [Deltaproteobacteria bacterium]
MRVGRWLACAAIWAWASGCGAEYDSAPPDPPRSHCKTIDERLAPLAKIAEAGKTQHIAHVIRTRLDPASQKAFVQLVLSVADALPAGTAEKLPQLLAPEGIGAILPFIVALLETLPGDPSAHPPLPPQVAELTAFSAVAQKCLTGELFVLGARVFRDPRTAPAVDALLGAGSSSAGQVLSLGNVLNSLQQSGAQGRKGFQTLVANLATALSLPGFDGRPLLVTLDHLVDAEKPGALGALRDLLVVALLGNKPADEDQARRALQAFAGCLLRLDPDQRIAGHLYDVLVTIDLQKRMPAGPVQSEPFLTLLAYSTDVLATQPAATDAWTQLLGLVLRPDVAVEALPELVDLLKSDALTGVFGLLGDLVTQPCKPKS